MNASKTTRKPWKKEEVLQVKNFFSMTRTLEEKENFAKELDRKYATIYAKNKDMLKALKKKPFKKKQTDVANITVTHVNQTVVPVSIKIRTGDNVLIETFSPKIKINDVFVEV